jgi:glycosyltransferase involved in cell wall biosynthesis
MYNALVSASARSASHVITDSKASKRDIVDHLGIRADEVTPIYLAAGSEFRPEPDLLLDMAIAQKYELPEEYILYLGGYEIHKNVAALLKAYTYARKAFGADYPLVLAGKKPEKKSRRYPDYDRHIAHLELEEAVHWAGYIDEEDKPALYRGAASFAFPSKYEGFGLPPLEAMASGVPVVASNRSSLPEVIGDAGFTLDPDDHRGIGGSIIATIVQEDLAEEMGRKGIEQAAKFSWEKTTTETLLIYDRVIGS